MKMLPMADLDAVIDAGLFEMTFRNWKIVERFPIRGLKRMEPILNKSQVDYYKSLTTDYLPVRIVIFGKNKVIWDGNHRVHARLNKGYKTVRALVYEVK